MVGERAHHLKMTNRLKNPFTLAMISKDAYYNNDAKNKNIMQIWQHIVEIGKRNKNNQWLYFSITKYI